jgi:hypothetical protein
VRKLSDIRRENTKRAVAQFPGGGAAVARAMGHVNPAFLSQMIGPKASRNVTEDTARRLEQAMGLPSGTLDRDPEAEPVAAPAGPGMSVDLVASVVRLVGQVCEGEKISVGSPKFADLVALALVDGLEHGGAPRPDHIKALVKLAK